MPGRLARSAQWMTKLWSLMPGPAQAQPLPSVKCVVREVEYGHF